VALFLTFLILVTTIIASVLMHFEALQILARRPLHGRLGLVGAVLALLAAHLLEVGLFGTAFYGATKWLGIGSFAGEHGMTAIDYYYYAAETYSSLGYGDIYPVGEIRLMASVTPIVGILLLGWSSTFLYSNLKLPSADLRPETPRNSVRMPAHAAAEDLDGAAPADPNMGAWIPSATP